MRLLENQHDTLRNVNRKRWIPQSFRINCSLIRHAIQGIGAFDPYARRNAESITRPRTREKCADRAPSRNNSNQMPHHSTQTGNTFSIDASSPPGRLFRSQRSRYRGAKAARID